MYGAFPFFIPVIINRAHTQVRPYRKPGADLWQRAHDMRPYRQTRKNAIVGAAISRPQNCCAPTGFPPAEGKCNERCNEVLQRRSKHFYSVVLYSISFFIKVRCFRCTGRKKPQKIPVLCGFLSLTHCNEPATNLQPTCNEVADFALNCPPAKDSCPVFP